MAPTTLPHTIRHHSSGCFVTLFFGVFLMLGLVAFTALMVEVLGVPALVAIGISATIAFASLAFLLFFFSTDHVVTVDEKGLLVTGQSRLGPIRGPAKTITEVQWAAVGDVHDVERTVRTKHGGTQKHYELRFGKKSLSSAVVGTMQRDGLYLELIQAIRLAVGDRLSSKTDLGDLDAAVRKVVDAQRRNY